VNQSANAEPKYGFERITPEQLRATTKRLQLSVESEIDNPYRVQFRKMSSTFGEWMMRMTMTGGSPKAVPAGLELKRLNLLENMRPILAEGRRPLVVVDRSRVLGSLFAFGAFEARQLLCTPYIHFLGEEGHDAGGLLHDWADAVAIALASGTQPACVLVVSGCGDERLNGDYVVAGMVDNRPKYLKLSDGSCVVHYFAQRSVWRMAALGVGPRGSTVAMYESAEYDSAGCGLLCGAWKLALYVEGPAPCIRPSDLQCRGCEDSPIIVSGAGEAMINGEYRRHNFLGTKPVYKKIDDPSCTIFFDERSEEWRIYQKGFKNDITLYKNHSRSASVPCGEWQNSAEKSIEPVPETSIREFPPLFTEAPDGTLMPMPKDEQLPSDDPIWPLYFGVGRFLGIGLALGLPLPLSFNNVTLRLMLGQEISPEDIARLDPQFYNTRLGAVLKPGGLQALEEALGEPPTFISAPTAQRPEPKELVPGGAARRVDESNKGEYVRLLCEEYVCGGVRTDMKLMLEGFADIIEPGTLEALDISIADLSLLMCGLPSYDLNDWEKHTVYSEAVAEDEPTKAWFFSALARGDETMRGRVLHFVTGSSRVPVGGFVQMRPPFRIHVYSADGPHLPSAHACSNTLDLPRYEDAMELERQLLFAVENAGGFGFK
jgi:hypothetical protein